MADLTFLSQKNLIQGTDIRFFGELILGFLYKLAYNSGFLCKFAAEKTLSEQKKAESVL